MSGFEALMAGVAVSAAAGTVMKGAAESRMQRESASIAEAQALREREAAAAEEDDFRRDASRAAARDRARRAASGIDPDSGTSLLVAEDTAGEAELSALRIRDAGEVRSFRLDQEAKTRRRAAKTTMIGSLLGAGTTLLTAAARWPRGAGSLASTGARTDGLGDYANWPANVGL